MRTAIAKPETSHNIAQTRTDHPGLSLNSHRQGVGGGVPVGAGQDH